MERFKIRKPAVAGQFYQSSSLGLKKQIEALVDPAFIDKGKDIKAPQKQNVIACMLPHAGYMYSGRVAGHTVSRINIKERVILLGPNHTGYGRIFSIMTEGVWQSPLGELEIDSEIAKKILSHSKYLEEDPIAHAYEHSLEVELPFLQYFKPNFRIIPIALLSEKIDALKEIGKEIADIIKENKIADSTLIVASSDMTHYEPEESAQRKDKEAIQAITELNEDELMKKILKFNISMCGFAPVAVMLSAAKQLGAKNAQLVKYQTSGDVTGETDSVVGYAGVIIY